jgi:hypothetical protein
MSKEPTLQIDDTVKIPRAVREAAARSQQIFDAVKAQGEQPAEPVTPSGNEPPPELNAQNFGQMSQDPAPVDPAPREDDQSWEHKYKSVHGRYVRQSEQLREMSDQITNLQNVIATLQAQPQMRIPELQAESLLTAEEVKDYGDDFLKVVGKKAREELTPVVKQYEAKIAELENRLQGLTGVVAQDSHTKLLSSLDTKMPNWRDLNTNEEFLDWLKLPDPFSGAIRHDMLKAAYAQGNASRVLAFFNGFLAEEAAVAPAKGEPDNSVTRVTKVPLENFAAPGRAKTAAGSNGTPAEKPIFTRAQIASFYAEVAAGKYRGRDDVKMKMETQIFEAQREGRIR